MTPDLAAAADLRGLLDDAHRWRRTWAGTGATGLPEFALTKLRAAWDTIVARAAATHPHQPGRTGGHSKARNIARRRTERREDYLRWAGDFTVPYSNKASEPPPANTPATY